MNNKRLIAKIFNGEEVIMTIDRNMLSCEFGALDRGNITDVVNWGIYANRGSISFIDNIGYFNSQNVNSTDIKKYIVKFYLTKDNQILISTFKIDNVDFEEETKATKIELISKVIEKQKKIRSKRYYPFSETTAYDLPGSMGYDTKNLKKINIYCPFFPSGINKWEEETMICQATMSRVVEDENGNSYISGSHPTKNPIIVRPKNIINISSPSFVRISNTSIDVTNRKMYNGLHYDTDNNTIIEPFGNSNDCYISYDSNDKPIFISGAEEFEIIEKSYGYDAKVVVKTGDEKIYRVDYAREVIDGYEGIVHFRADFIDDNHFVASITIVTSSRKVEKFYFSFLGDYFIDGDQSELQNITNAIEDISKIPSSELVQANSYYLEDSGDKIQLGEYILRETNRRYGNGIECFEIECLFNDYYDENGNKVFDTNDLSNHFEKYDLIIPYVNKKGQAVPLRVNQDGTPKQFRVIGISYSYDGLLKQKLSVQEERYDVD